MTRFLSLALLISTVACSESFLPASAVTDFRVVAARVEADGDATRANPGPGEEAQVALLPIDRGAFASDDPAANLTPSFLQWALVACLPLPVTIGTPICGTLPFDCEGCDATPPEDLLATPIVRFTVPSAEELESAGATSALLQGVVCSNGEPSEDAILQVLMGESDDLVPCVEADATVAGVPVEGRVVAVSIPIEDMPEDPNLNPELLDVQLNGRSWPPPYDQGVPRDAPKTGCAGDLESLTPEQRGAHPRAAEPPSTINLFVTSASLQEYTLGNRMLTEEIQVSWLGDGGGFQRTFSFITFPASSVLTNWQPPPTAPTGGELVRFNFVIRDGRGGTDWVERGLCVLPPEPEPPPP